MSSRDVHALAASLIYFAYGSNISSEQMQSRCPNAQRIGVAYLYGWRRSFCVRAPHLGGLVAGIEKSDDASSCVVGVAYEMTPSDRDRLDAIEHGGYQPSSVGIKINGAHRDAYTHVPLRIVAEVLSEVPEIYLQVMISGAEENGITDLAAKLRQVNA
jgi:cation transport regulator ChaC